MFTAERLRRLSEIERWHFWFTGRYRLICALMAKHIALRSLVLDVGCGTGYSLGRFIKNGYNVVGLDRRSEGLRAVKENIPSAALVQSDATRLPFTSGKFHAALLLDVIEHVDDHALLTELNRLLAPGCIAIISAPAMPWLWSYRDDAAGHLRRYTRKSLNSVLTDAGFSIVDIRYYQFFLFPLLLFTRLFGKKNATLRDAEDLPPRLLNTILMAINIVDASLGQLIHWPVGSSLVAVCKKR